MLLLHKIALVFFNHALILSSAKHITTILIFDIYPLPNIHIHLLQVQKMLKICAERLTEKAEHQAMAVLGIALVTLGEDVGTEMSLRTFDHLLQYAELPVKRVVPLAIALMYVSNPDYAIVDQLSRLSHDTDAEVAQGAILALGLVSAGTNNSRVAGLLRSLSEFYAKEVRSNR